MAYFKNTNELIKYFEDQHLKMISSPVTEEKKALFKKWLAAKRAREAARYNTKA